MRIAVIADDDRAEAFLAALEARGLEGKRLEPEGPDPSGPVALLAAGLLWAEARLSEDRPNGLALLGAGDRSFAGVLVATKLGVPVFWLGAGSPLAGAEGSPNGDLIGRLADHTVSADPVAAAEEIADLVSASA